MTRPGDRLRALAAHVYDAETMERLIDPVVADLQAEYAEAARAGRVWHRRWVKLAGYIALARVTTRSMRVFLTLAFVMTLLLELPALTRYGTPFVLFSLLYLAPQALVVAVPIALTLAIAWASRSARQSHRAMIGTLVSGAICSALSFVLLAWWVPPANQAFRVKWGWEAGMTYRPSPGPPEMTIGELRQQMTWATTGHANWVHVNQGELVYTYYFRLAFGCASLSLAILMLALRRRVVKRRSMVLAAVPIFLGYDVLMYFGRDYALHSGVLQAAVGAWMPNVVTVLVAAAIGMRGPRRLVAE